ncbi:MAG: hypothetical protein ACYDH2_14895 [Anaerolineaceae bacterium]
MKPITAHVVLCLIFIMVITGCAPKTGTEQVNTPALTAAFDGTTPTLAADKISITPTPTKIVTGPTMVIKTLEGTSIPPIVLTQATPEDTATLEPTVDEKYFPNALIQILAPGSMSQLASPFTVQASVFPGADGLVSMQLFGEDGRLIHDQLLKLSTAESGWSNLVEEISFEIPSAGESAMLVVTTTDEFGRRITQAVTQIFLMQIGKSDINDFDFIKQPYIVKSFKDEAVIKGGVVHVAGFAHSYNSNPIIIELLTESGGVMETQIVKLPRGSENLNYVPFSADIPYDVGISTPVRMTIRQRSLLLPNIDNALASWTLTLKP